jgi:hypothetical protein
MEHLKTLSAVVTAAIALIAFAPPGIASATELYSGATTLKAGTEVVASPGGSVSFITTEGITWDTCGGAGFKGKLSNTGGSTETVKLEIGASDFTWTNCTHPQATLAGGSMEIHYISGTSTGTVTAAGFEFTMQTATVGSCVFTFGAGTHLGTLTGSTAGNAVIHMNAVMTRKTGLCPSSMRWAGTFTVTSPKPLHVTAS